MDSLKTLMDRKQYDLVIKLTENSNDPIALFYRLSALLAVGQTDEALNVINTKRLILQKKLALLIKFHIEILCLLKRFDDAYLELRYYQDLPYESQEVEEILRIMPDYIRKEEKNSYQSHHVDENELRSRLLSKNDEEVLAALDEIKDLPVNNFLLNILKLIRSHPRQVIRSFALLLLVNQKYDKEVEFLHFDKLIKVVPASLEEPFQVPGFDGLENLSYVLQTEYHDPSVAQNALHIISSYLLYIYPRKLDLGKDETIVVFGYLAKKLLMSKTDDLKTICEDKGLDYDFVSDRIKEIEEDLNNF